MTQNANKNKVQKHINIALAIFGLAIVVFSVLGAYILDNYSTIQQIEELAHYEEDTYKGEIDERLRFIALQDDNLAEMKTQDTDKLNNEEIVDSTSEQINDLPETITLEPDDISNLLLNRDTNIPKTKFEEYNEKYKKKELSDEANTDNIETKITDISQLKNVVQPTSPLNLKIVIGNFPTKEAAETKLLEISSQFSTPPFIKQVNNTYAIQVAAFKTPETAYEYVNSLRQQGFSARIIEE